MLISHDRLPKDVSKVCFNDIVNLFLVHVLNKEGIDSGLVRAHFGKTDARGVVGIKIKVNNTCNAFATNFKVNGWSGFANMRELVAYLEGYCAAIA